ncbi:MAG: sulfite reductase subunit alpha [Pseudomonadota bacterium]
MTSDPVRLAIAASMLAAWLLLCCLTVLRQRKLRVAGAPADWLVAYASQTGTGEYLAGQTVATLQTGGLAARSISLEHLDAAGLRGAQRILFIASTYGEGDAPDSGASFARMLSNAQPALGQLHYAVLALGDSSYAHFCGFGRGLDQLLQARGAQPLFPLIEVDRVAPPAIAEWRRNLSCLAGASDAPDWSAPGYGRWRIATRTHLNPGSAGAPVYDIELTPLDGALPVWEAGDLAQLSAPAEPGFPREYSIASTCSEGSLRLLVRLHLRDDGSRGVASGWLCEGAAPGQSIALRVRVHQRFRLGDNAERPLILIGNGTGIAGLRAHLKARIDMGKYDNWLLFGERNEAHDFHYWREIQDWHVNGQLGSLGLAFSRDGGEARYVQHLLAQHRAALRAWVARGAAIYVCGSLDGMAGGVHQQLVEALGEERVIELADSGRYRRDVY